MMKCPARAISTRGVDVASSTISLLADSEDTGSGDIPDLTEKGRDK